LWGGRSGDIFLVKLVGQIGWRQILYLFSGIGFLVVACIWWIIPNKENSLNMNYSQKISFKQFFAEVFLLIKNPQMWLIGLVGFLLYLPLSAFAELWGILYLERSYGLSSRVAAQAISMIFLGWVSGGPLTGWLSDHFNNRRFLYY